MCYMIVISTTSDADLAIYNSRFVDFSRNLPDVNAASLLKFEHKWFLGSKDGCSCGFRHLESRNVELGFSEPADWMPEDGEDIAATLEVFGVLKSIVSAGARLDRPLRQ